MSLVPSCSHPGRLHSCSTSTGARGAAHQSIARHSALNPLAPLPSMLKAKASATCESGASSAAIKAEIEVLQKRSLELEHQAATLGARPSRREIKARRDDLRRMLHRVDLALSDAAEGPEQAAPPAAPPRLELQPPVLDPREILPAHLIEKFRAEYRLAQQQRNAATQNETLQQPDANLRVLPPTQRPTLEQYQADRFHAPRTPPTPTDLATRVHGVQRHAFTQYGGSQSVSEVWPRGGRRTFAGRGR